MKKNFLSFVMLSVVTALLVVSLCILTTCKKNNESDISSSEYSGTHTSDTIRHETPYGSLEFFKTQSETSDIQQYLLYIPKNAVSNMPLIVYLHGGSGKGDDPNLITSTDDLPKYLCEGVLGEVNAYVLIPQLPEKIKGWKNAEKSLITLIDYVVSSYDISDISLTGHSMGGTGTWAIAADYPGRFSKIAPLSGSAYGLTDEIDSFLNIPIWAFVGSADTIIPPESSEALVEKITNAGGNAKITIFDGADHFSVPNLAFSDNDINLIGWLTEK